MLNINVGVMGHVDSGKTSLVRALSTVLSTAALDKHPQSKSRGITMDLGFSSFTVPAPPKIASATGREAVQFTLVDCPGHATLIKTIIGGAQIIDMMVLVVDVVKGVQTQTAECLVIGEVTTDNMIVVLNKVDLLDALATPAVSDSIVPASGGAATGKKTKKHKGGTAADLLASAERKVRSILKSTRFADAPIIALSAAPGGSGKGGAGGDGGAGRAAAAAASADVTGLVELLRERVTVPRRDTSGPLFMAVDHCFNIKGQGTVMTGTVLHGSLSVGDEVLLPELGETRKVWSMQMFRRDVKRIEQGDRAGISVRAPWSGKVERAVLVKPGTALTVQVVVALVRRIKHFRGDMRSGPGRFHLTVGHATVMASAHFFGAQELAHTITPADASGAESRAPYAPPAVEFDWDAAFEWQDSLLAKLPETAAGPPPDPEPAASAVAAAASGAGDSAPSASSKRGKLPWQWALLHLDSPVVCQHGAVVIGSRLDADPSANSCRLAFAGALVHPVAAAEVAAIKTARGWAAATPSAKAGAAAGTGGKRSAAVIPPDVALHTDALSCIKIYKPRERTGTVERVTSGDGASGSGPCEAVCKGMFTKSSDMTRFLGLSVVCDGGAKGTFVAPFGKSGKFKIRVAGGPIAPGTRVTLPIRKFMFGPDKKTVKQ
jgi:selenocysteine-specific elongation factor